MATRGEDVTLKPMLGALALATLLFSSEAGAQVRDATYRGTLVCAKLPFFEVAAREAFELVVTGNSAKYTHVVREASELSSETGSGNIDGQGIVLTGGWRGKRENYEARYTGKFVRRSFNLAGTQTWVHEGKAYTRACSGSIKRPFAIFLPPQKS